MSGKSLPLLLGAFGILFFSLTAYAGTGAWSFFSASLSGSIRTITVTLGGVSHAIPIDHDSPPGYHSFSEWDEEDWWYLTNDNVLRQLELTADSAVVLYVKVNDDGDIIDCSVDMQLLAGAEPLASAAAYDYALAHGNSSLSVHVKNAFLDVIDLEACP